MVHADPVALAHALTLRLTASPPATPAWTEAWLDAGRAADTAMRRVIAGFDDPFEGGIFAQLRGRFRWARVVVVGSSMPVRDLDAFLASSDVTGVAALPTGVSTASMASSRRHSASRPRTSARSCSWLVTCPSSMTSTPWSRHVCSRCRRPSWSSTTTAAASSRSCPRAPPIGPSSGCRSTMSSCSAHPTAWTCWPSRASSAPRPRSVDPPPSVRRIAAFDGPTRRPGPASAHRSSSGTWCCIARSQAGRGRGTRVMHVTLADGVRYAVHESGRWRSRAAHPRLHRQRPSWTPLLPDAGARPPASLRSTCWVMVTSDSPARGTSRARAPGRGPGGSSCERLDAAPADVLGYSLGARVALRWPSTLPQRPATHPRITLGRASRTRPRGRHAARQTSAGSTSCCEATWTGFVRDWAMQPIFASHATLTPDGSGAARRRATSRNDPIGLAASLLGAGQGVMAPLHDRLGEHQGADPGRLGPARPAWNGARRRGRRRHPGREPRVIDDAGHTPHLETPERIPVTSSRPWRSSPHPSPPTHH